MRIATWTLAWTLFQWWAVIGWPSGSDAVAVSMACTGIVGLVAAAVLYDVRSARGQAAAVVPIRRRPDVGEPSRDRGLAA